MKKQKFLTSKVFEHGYDNIMFVQELQDGGMLGESSNTICVVKNLEVANAKKTYVCDHETIQNKTEDAQEEEYGL